MIKLLKMLFGVSRIKEKRILSSPNEPPTTEWLWLKRENNESSLKEYLNGKWQTVLSGTINVSDIDRRMKDLTAYVDKCIAKIPSSIDLSNYCTSQQLEDRINAIVFPEVHDGITPHIDNETGNWFLGDSNTGVKAEGKGIRSIDYRGTNVSGAANTLTIETTDGERTVCQIFNGRDGAPGQGVEPQQPEYIISEVTQLGMGTFLQAVEKANQTHGATMFQWILSQNDSNGVPFKKIIWHIGNGVFIDALGSVITNE